MGGDNDFRMWDVGKMPIVVRSALVDSGCAD